RGGELPFRARRAAGGLRRRRWCGAERDELDGESHRGLQSARRRVDAGHRERFRSVEMTTTSAVDTATPRAWRTLRWTCTAVFMALLDATILFVAFPSIRRSYATVSTADLSWILNAYTIVYAALLVPAGRMADRMGRRRVFLGGVGLFTLGSLACGLAPTPLLIVGGP